MNKVPFETISFTISITALIYGIVNIAKYKMPLYFKIHIAAVGCYVLEELWVIVNALFGGYNDLVSVRLFGIFGFLCFLLSANTGGIDRLVDEAGESNHRIRLLSLIAPVSLSSLYVIFSVLRFRNSIFNIVLSIIVFTPAFIASYYNLKHLLLKNDDMGFLDCIRSFDVVSLIFYYINIIYFVDFPDNMHSILYYADIVMSVLVFILVICSIKGGKKWKTLL